MRVWGAGRTRLPITGCLFRGLSTKGGLDQFWSLRKGKHLPTKLHEKSKVEAVKSPLSVLLVWSAVLQDSRVG